MNNSKCCEKCGKTGWQLGGDCVSCPCHSPVSELCNDKNFIEKVIKGSNEDQRAVSEQKEECKCKGYKYNYIMDCPIHSTPLPPLENDWAKDWEKLLNTLLKPNHAYNIVINSEGDKNKLLSFIRQQILLEREKAVKERNERLIKKIEKNKLPYDDEVAKQINNILDGIINIIKH